MECGRLGGGRAVCGRVKQRVDIRARNAPSKTRNTSLTLVLAYPVMGPVALAEDGSRRIRGRANYYYAEDLFSRGRQDVNIRVCPKLKVILNILTGGENPSILIRFSSLVTGNVITYNARTCAYLFLMINQMRITFARYVITFFARYTYYYSTDFRVWNF